MNMLKGWIHFIKWQWLCIKWAVTIIKLQITVPVLLSQGQGPSPRAVVPSSNSIWIWNRLTTLFKQVLWKLTTPVGVYGIWNSLSTLCNWVTLKDYHFCISVGLLRLDGFLTPWTRTSREQHTAGSAIGGSMPFTVCAILQYLVPVLLLLYKAQKGAS